MQNGTPNVLEMVEKTLIQIRKGGIFNITVGGNFEGVNIPNLLKSNDLYADFGEEIQKLFDYRKKRSRLHLDDKILTSWNALMIAALSILYRVSRKEEYLWAAVNAQVFLEKDVSRGLCLLASWRKGKASKKGFLDDYAFYTAALTELYHATLNREYPLVNDRTTFYVCRGHICLEPANTLSP